jgi:hypothetical protein
LNKSAEVRRREEEPNKFNKLVTKVLVVAALLALSTSTAMIPHERLLALIMAN